MQKRWLFASDIHLTPARPAIVELFHRFLAEEAARAERLYLLGDVFDLYTGKRQAEHPATRATLELLRALVAAGVRVEMLHGNRDFLAGPELGLDAVHASDVVVEGGGRRLLLAHGDLFCTRDHSYQRARRVLRSRPVRALAAYAPLGLVAAFGQRLRGYSRQVVAAKGGYATDLAVEAVQAAFLAHDADAIIAGHVHRRRDLVGDLAGRRRRFVGLADWGDTGIYAVLEPDGRLHLERFPAGAVGSSLPDSSEDSGVMARSLVITIDGPAGSGKSTVARRAAAALGIAYLDTGAMYRALAWASAAFGVPLEDEDGIARLFDGAKLELRANGEVLWDGRDITRDIRTSDVTTLVSRVAAMPSVRARMVSAQRRIAAAAVGGVVTEGRDQGTVAFPDAAFKFFLTADLRVRAGRRVRELAAAGEPVAEATLLESLARRDLADQQRGVGPLRPPEDAIVIDSTELDADQVTARVLEIVRARRSP